MLDELARDYEGDARTEDAHTRTMARREGFELTGLTAVDMLVAIVLSTWEYERLDQDGVARLAALLDLATPIVVVALRALEESRLLYADGTRRVNRTLLRHHLLQEPSPFRVTSLGMRGMGLPTALSSAAISSELSEPHDAFVTPLEGGSAAGIVVPPLHPRAPYVAEKSPKVAMILALVDVLRLPQPGQRAVNLARSKLAEVL